MKRLFDERQKKILYILANGVCQICGKELKKGWHADHIIPFSKGGKTEIKNGQALCQECNLNKSNNMIEHNFTLRKWQGNCLTDFRKKFEWQESYLLVAGVGSGKTFISCIIAAELIQNNGFDSIIVVSPTENIKLNWQKTFFKNFEIDLDFNFSFKYDWRNDFDGITTTFQSLNEINSEFLRRRVNKGTLLIIDEIHHAGDNKAWGQSIQDIGENCGFVLSLSGTPTRSDNSKIPFVKYIPIEDNKYQLKSDFYYSYAESIREKHCCPVRFHKTASDVETIGGSKKLDCEQDLDEARRVLNRILEAKEHGDCYVFNTFEKARIQLSEMNDRRGQNYAGLIVCNSIKDAKTLHKRIIENYGRDFAELVVSDDREANKRLEEFKESATPWIVSVNMVSEGVDIPRIRVIQYATNITTMLFFMQVIGRGVRNAVHFENDIDTCHVFIPEYKPMVDNAKQIEDSIVHVIEEIEKEIRDRKERGEIEGLQISIEDIVLGATSELTGSIYSSEELSNEDISWINAMAIQNNITPDSAIAIITGFKKRQSTGKEAKESIKPITERKKDYRKKIHKVVAMIHHLSGWDFPMIHNELNKRVGKKLGKSFITTDEMNFKDLKEKYQQAINLHHFFKSQRSGDETKGRAGNFN